MTTLFRYGFQQEAWRPTLGQAGIADVLNTSLTTGANAYKSYTDEEKAKAAADAAQANAQTAAANAQAAAIAAMANQPSSIMGIPSTYFWLGLLAIGAVAVAVVAKKK